MVGEREAAGEEEAIAFGESNGSAEQGMVCGALASGGYIGAWSPGFEPEALALEGVRGQRDTARRRQERGPVEGEATGVELGEGEEEAREGALVAAQRTDDE